MRWTRIVWGMLFVAAGMSLDVGDLHLEVKLGQGCRVSRKQLAMASALGATCWQRSWPPGRSVLPGSEKARLKWRPLSFLHLQPHLLRKIVGKAKAQAQAATSLHLHGGWGFCKLVKSWRDDWRRYVAEMLQFLGPCLPSGRSGS